EILSYGAYTLIKKGNGKNFIKNVLSKDTNKLKHLLNEFISELNCNSYDLYLKEVILIYSDNTIDYNDYAYNDINNIKLNNKSNIDDTENKFDDGRSSSDSESII